MGSERDETYTILVKGKPLASVKADLIHAFLSVRLKSLGLHSRLNRFYWEVEDDELFFIFIFVDCGFESQRRQPDVVQGGVPARHIWSRHVPASRPLQRRHCGDRPARSQQGRALPRSRDPIRRHLRPHCR